MFLHTFKTYQVWHVDVPMEYVEAIDSFSSRKAFAEKHHKPLTECMARLQPCKHSFVTDSTGLIDTCTKCGEGRA